MNYYKTSGGYFYKKTKTGAVRISEEEFRKKSGSAKLGRKDFEREEDAAEYLFDNARDIKWFYVKDDNLTLIKTKDKIEESDESDKSKYLGVEGVGAKNIAVGTNINGTNYFSVLTGDKKVIAEWEKLLNKNKSSIYRIYIFIQGRHKKFPVVEFCNMLNDNDLLKKAQYVNIEVKDKKTDKLFDMIGVSAKGIWGFKKNE